MANQTHTDPAPWNFKAAFCEAFGCPAEAFQEALFRKCLHSPLRPVASLVRLMFPGFFCHDLDNLERVGQTTTWLEFLTLANHIRDDLALTHGLLHKGLHLRISGRRLIRIYEEITRRSRKSLL